MVEKECEHLSVYGSLCVTCGATVEKSASRVKFVPKGVVAGPKVEISSVEANEMAQASLKRLRSLKRFSLVLDLDHTLLECTMNSRNLPPPKSDSYHEITVQGRVHRVRLRPHLDEFFRCLSPLYESTIYTHGSREYALAVADLIEKTVSCARFGGRIVSRDDAPDLSAKAEKRLDRAFPGLGGTASSFIVDDRYDVWVGRGDFDRLFLVEPYKYFDRIDHGDQDSQLLHTMRALVHVHKTFFEEEDDDETRQRPLPSTPTEALVFLRESVFESMSLYFVTPNPDIQICRRFALAFGARVVESYSEASHVVVDERRRDRRRSSYAASSSTIDPDLTTCVHLDWFWFSVWHLRKEDPKKFFVPPHQIIFKEDLFNTTINPPPSKRFKLDDDDDVIVPEAEEDEGEGWADDFAAEIEEEDEKA